MLSLAGRIFLSATLRQRAHLFGPGVAPLKDIVKNYAALNGAQKALLGSVQLIAFRGILASVATMVSILFFVPDVKLGTAVSRYDGVAP